MTPIELLLNLAGVRLRVDGGWVGRRRRRHGDHHHRHSLGACRLQHRGLHAAAVWAVSRDEHLGRGDLGTGPLGVIG
jgi:hypothetical protein